MIDCTSQDIPQQIIEFTQKKSIFGKRHQSLCLEYLGEISKKKIYLKTKDNCLEKASIIPVYIIDDGQNIRYSNKKEQKLIQEFDTRFRYYNEIQNKRNNND